jgi:hypothetical protein
MALVRKNYIRTTPRGCGRILLVLPTDLRTPTSTYRLRRALMGDVEAIVALWPPCSSRSSRVSRDAAQRGCRSRRCGSIRRIDAHRFYARLGFVSSPEGYKLVL